jgi:hypothetical protein
VAEELLGEPLDKPRYVTGHTLPGDYSGPRASYELPDVVLRRGERVAMKTADAAREMGPGDVFLKGANAINYERGQAGVLIGHSTGGTVGAAIGSIVARKVHLIHPVGLEKSVPGDLRAAAQALCDPHATGPALWVTPGRLFTEIEAIRALCGVRAVPIGAGGIGGAEGAVWLACFGTREELDVVESLLDDIRGEPPFLQ